jgi:hypothetical protein
MHGSAFFAGTFMGVCFVERYSCLICALTLIICQSLAKCDTWPEATFAYQYHLNVPMCLLVQVRRALLIFLMCTFAPWLPGSGEI